nr:DUF4158 domain-containing protein [Enterococcus faecalis]
MYNLTSAAQRKALLSLDKLSKDEFQGYFSFSRLDVKFILSHRGVENRLGIGLQLCLARYPGISLSLVDKVSNSLIEYVAAQLKISTIDLDNYLSKKNTPLVHLKEICRQYNYSLYSSKAADYLNNILTEAIQENNDELFLINLAIYRLREQRILLPEFSEIERLISTIRQNHEKYLYKKIVELLSVDQKERLDSLLVVNLDTKKSKLAWLQDISGKPSKDTILSICDRISVIKGVSAPTEQKIPIETRTILVIITYCSCFYQVIKYDFLLFNNHRCTTGGYSY